MLHCTKYVYYHVLVPQSFLMVVQPLEPLVQVSDLFQTDCTYTKATYYKYYYNIIMATMEYSFYVYSTAFPPGWVGKAML